MYLSRSKFTAITLLAVVGLAACGDTNGGGYDYGSPPTDAATTVAVSDTPTGGIASVDVTLTDSTFGPIVSDGGGNTLYMYAPDSPAAATCTGGCAGAWPPFLFDGAPSVGDGLAGDLFTTVPGEGGTQLAYNGHPLYHFAGDSAPGDTNGQGSGGVWFILNADGNQITA
ncbi:lipoprotein [soil metagenome]